MEMRHSDGEIDVTEWLFDDSPFGGILGSAASKILGDQFKEDPPWLLMGSKDKPAALLLWLSALGKDEDNGPWFELSLYDLIATEVDDCVGGTGALDEDARPRFEALAAELRRLTEYVEGALARQASETEE